MNVQTLIDWIQLATIGVLIATTIIQGKRISNLKDEIKGFEETTGFLERSIDRLRNSRKHDSEEAKRLFKQLLGQLDKKLMPIEEVTHISYNFMGEEEEHTAVVGYEVVDLTDGEKRARELRQEADELEGEEE